jgi:RecA-family ATPase
VLRDRPLRCLQLAVDIGVLHALPSPLADVEALDCPSQGEAILSAASNVHTPDFTAPLSIQPPSIPDPVNDADLIAQLARETRELRAQLATRKAGEMAVTLDGLASHQEQSAVAHVALNWDDLEGKQPPARDWILPHWIPAGHSTLLAGRAGIGKTLLAQHIGTALALAHEFMEPVQQRRVLMWAGEDDEAELWRRQIRINSHMRHPLSALSERFFLHSYAGADITLAAPVFGRLQPTPLLGELRIQVKDYRAELVIVDNAARVYGGNENDRHSATTFLAWLQSACAPAAILLLSHPAKAEGSEYSGSTAWEGAVRARLYLSDRPPDAKDGDEDAPIDDRVRYLSRRKANYSALDMRRFSLVDGVLIADTIEPERTGARVSGEFAKDIVRRAITKLAEKGVHGSLSTASPEFLPKLAKQYGLLDSLTTAQFGTLMRTMILGGEITKAEVGKYQNRTPKTGLVLP